MYKFIVPRLDHWLEEAKNAPEPTYMVEGLVPSDSITILTGTAKEAYKTWFTFLLSMCVASGKSAALINPKEQGGVLIIELEGPRKQTYDRWKMLEKGSGINLEGLPIYFWHRGEVLLNKSQHVKAICKTIAANNIKFVVIDTLAKSMQGDENSSSDVGDIMRAMDRLREANDGVSICFIHHLGKPAQGFRRDIDDEVRGSSSIKGFYDSHLAIRKLYNIGTYLVLIVRSSDAEEKQFLLKWEISSKTQSAELKMHDMSLGFPKDFLEEAVSSWMPGEVYDNKSLMDNWRTDYDSVVNLIRALRDADIIEKQKKGYSLA